METIKAIETEYNGYRFRSRLEARWAVFFDAAGIKYQYEPEGFEVSNFYQDGKVYRYLPDFYLPQFKCYAEVKPTKEKLLEDGEKLSMMIDFNNTPIADGLLILGQIPVYVPGYVPHFAYIYWHKGVVAGSAAIEPAGIPYEFVGPRLWLDLSGSCTTCPDFPDLPPFIDSDLYGICPITQDIGNKTFVMASFCQEKIEDRLKDCFDKARKARFEHGEKP